METEVFDIVLKKNADFEAVFEFWDDDGNIDISTDTFEAKVKENINDSDDDVKATFAFTIFQDSDDDDKWKVKMAMADTVINQLTIKSGVYDMFRIFSDGFRANPFEGSITVKKNVTPVAP
jgi:hypothetical protein